MTNAIPNVPRELLERASNLAFQTQHYPLHEELRTLLSAPSPAGVDGLKRYEVFPYLDDEVAEIDICESDDGSFVKYEDAQGIIDGLRGDLAVALKVPSVAAMHAYLDTECAKDNMRLGAERDRQARRIGELEGLLLRVQVSLSLDDTEWGYSGAEKYKLLADIRAALSDGKEGSDG